ncbi:MAG: hypothetical protein ACE366_23505 [Bradymonadia bacterium]
MKTILMALALSCCATVAHAKIKGKILNCSGEKIRIKVYDAKDGVRSVTSSATSLKDGESWNFKCKGQGKGFCQVQVWEPGCGSDSLGYLHRLKSNDTHVLEATGEWRKSSKESSVGGDYKYRGPKIKVNKNEGDDAVCAGRKMISCDSPGTSALRPTPKAAGGNAKPKATKRAKKKKKK